MDTINNFSDGELLTIVKRKTEAERQLTIEVIELLREIYSRRLHLKRGFSSLHEFCVKELKYSDGAAYRRIKAMKLVEDIPEVAQSIQTGMLNLSVASQLQSAFEAKAKEKKSLTKIEKMELLGLVSNQSRREAERTIAKVFPETVRTAEKVRAINDHQVKLDLVIEGEFYKKIEKLKEFYSHKNQSIVQLLENLVDQELKRKDPERKTRPASPAKTNVEAPRSKNLESRYISSQTKHHVWVRDRGECTFVDPLTKRKCESKHKLTFEHIQPYSMGGDNSIGNLRLLCAGHNALTAINVFGEAKMRSRTQ